MKRIPVSLAASSIAAMAALPVQASVHSALDATRPVAKAGWMQLAQAMNGQGQQQRQRKRMRQRLHQDQQTQEDMTQSQTRTRTQTRQRMRQGR